jgi:hypothetical protein
MNEPIGATGTVAGFRGLVEGEQWHRNDFLPEMLEGGWRPLLLGETTQQGDEMHSHKWRTIHLHGPARSGKPDIRTKRPLPTIATPEPTTAPQSNNAAMRLDIAKHALQGLLSDSQWLEWIKLNNDYLGKRIPDIYAAEAVSFADALIRKLQQK